MKKLVGKLRKARKDPSADVPEPRRKDEVPDPKFIVLNPPSPLPAPAPNPGPNNKGLVQDLSARQEDDIATFSGFGSWMGLFEPNPDSQGIVEIAAQPSHVQPHVSEVLSMEEGWPSEYMIRLTLDNLKKAGSQLIYAVLVIGPWFMTIAQVNRLLAKHGYLETLSAKHGSWAAQSWNGDKALPSTLQIPVIDGPSRYDAAPGEGPLMCRSEEFGVFMHNLRRLRVRCQDGKVIATSFPSELEINFNRTLRLPEDGNTHNQAVRLGKISVNNIAGLSKKLEASNNQSLVDMARKGGVFFPLYQREAMFLSFKARQEAFAVRVFVGGVNAVSGLPWNSPPGYKIASQDYLSIPPQQFLDGVCVGKDVVRQFIAMPLGSGYSVEKQVTGKETVGGMQLEIIPGNRWTLQVPASPDLPQAGPYFPSPDEKPGRLGVQMLVLDVNRDQVESGSQKDGTDVPEDELSAKHCRPVYLRHLYQSQVEYPHPVYGQSSKPTDFYPGMNIRMTAVYILSLTLQYRYFTPNQDRIETVDWAPWWTLEKCFSEHQRLGSQGTAKPLRELELYHQGRRLYTGPLTLQEQGLKDGDVIMIQQPMPISGYEPAYRYGDQRSDMDPYRQSQYEDHTQGQTQGFHAHGSVSQNIQASQRPPGSIPSPAYAVHSQPSPQVFHHSSLPQQSAYPPRQSHASEISSPSLGSGKESYALPYRHSPPGASAPPASMSPPMPASMSPPMPASMSPPMSPSMSPPLSPSMSPPMSPSMSARYSARPAAVSPPTSSPSSTYDQAQPHTWHSAAYGPPRSSVSPSAPDYRGETGISPSSVSSASPAQSFQYASTPQSFPTASPATLNTPIRPQAKPQDQTGWAMGIAAGSRIRQAILADPFAPSAWCKDRAAILSVQILNSVAFESLTGMLAPSSPITPQMYLEQGLPFLASYEEGVATDGAAYLSGIKGVGDIDAMGAAIHLGSNVAGAKNVGCTCCGKMLCDSILRPCNHGFCSTCIREYMTYTYSPGAHFTVCRICSTRAEKLIGFSAPMALPGEDVVDLSDAKVITTEPFQGALGFQSVYELSAVPDDQGGKGYHRPYELQA